MNETKLTIAEIIDQARRESLSNKKIRSLLFHNGFDHKLEFPAIRDALGREKGDDGAANRLANELAELAAKTEREAREAKLAATAKQREADELAAREQRERDQAVARAAIADGDVIWCDAAENTVRRVVNRFGKKRKFDHGGYRIGLVCGEFAVRHYNSQCPDQFAAECYSVLKAVELALDCRLREVTVRNDRIGGFSASTKRGYIGAKYLWIAKKLATENHLTVAFDPCTSAENLADRVSRTEAD